MPFELGIDYGLKVGSENFVKKRILVTANQRYDYQIALSDIAGSDIRTHGNDYQQTIAEIRRWLHVLGLTDRSPTRIKSDYEDFQEWDLERLEADGWAIEDILDRGTAELLTGMQLWLASGRPPTHN